MDKKQKLDWEEEFNKLMIVEFGNINTYFPKLLKSKLLKDFIKRTLYCQREELREQMLGEPSFMGGGFVYPDGMQPDQKGEYDSKEKVWNVNGCCGGGCFVLRGLKYCPWCGKELRLTQNNENI